MMKLIAMKIIFLVFLSVVFFSAEARSSVVDKSDNSIEIITADLLISVPMIGNVSIKKVEEKLQEDLNSLTIMKAVNDSDEINFFY